MRGDIVRFCFAKLALSLLKQLPLALTWERLKDTPFKADPEYKNEEERKEK